jgi:AraC family transcriptional regulator
LYSSKAFDNVIQYLETIVINDSEIDYDEISNITISHAALFQRIFIFVSGISISDYVRKRRLTLAAHDLRNNDISILDIALKYGFQSHSAFTRSFKEHHGITPTEARLETVQINEYLPINFSDMRFIGGKRIMAEMKKIIYKESVERLFVGLNRKETTFPEVGKLWQEFFNSEAVEKLKTLSNATCCDDIDENDGIGIVYNFKGTDTFDIIIGDFLKL